MLPARLLNMVVDVLKLALTFRAISKGLYGLRDSAQGVPVS